MLEYILSFIATRGVTLDGILNKVKLEREWSIVLLFRIVHFSTNTIYIFSFQYYTFVLVRLKC